ncbi:tRNA adenosine(34) deaminase TadA [Pseudohaliea rubra]|uniref:tRNA-specific adenosine deaminase n=1 Tax=Pseudohaliea rubra DSM 19751 TaxID=1265313 RepID=A0A095XZ23_9GAMM|nr:tRNA adenosine(34) deaminase TadA [Pseudohaliea rubra]KGE05001.1 tRNA-specific adenosine-34 deaminase [Pseudohaliea rubra DSM 19751]
MAVTTDREFMGVALCLAEAAAAAGEVPIGAVLVRGGEILGEGANSVIGSRDPTAHAEVNALRAAGHCEGNYRLPGTVLYVTLEPCTMCVGALVHARVAELVFAALEPRAGAVCSTARLLDAAHYNHRVGWRQGPFAEESGELLRRFFRARR